MKPLFKALAVAACTLSTGLAAHAAPRQVVLIVAEGLNPQTIEFGSSYVKGAFEEGTEVAFDNFKAQAKSAPVADDTLGKLRGLLKTAKTNGWKTGLVTTGDAAAVGALFYDVAGNDAATTAKSLIQAAPEFLGGGGRASFAPDVLKALSDGGGTAITDVEGMDAEIKGQTVALAAEGELDYALDRDVEKNSSLSELASLAMQTLGANDAPFLLIVHDTLVAKAIAAKDTPALLEEFREIDTIVADALGRREENPEAVAVGVLATGATSVPQFTTQAAQERTDALMIVSQLPVSYSKAGRDLTGADAAKLTTFATETYKGWQLSPENRAAIVAGTLTPEAALRASYEPAIKVEFAPVAAQPMIHAVGFEPGADLVATLQTLAAAAPPAAPVVAPAP